MASLPAQFSEFAFGYTVTSQLVNCRVGLMSPWPTRSPFGVGLPYFFWHRKWFRAEYGYIERELVDSFKLSPDEARAVTNMWGAPFIPNQSLEKHFPVDLAMNSRGVCFLLQFKLSKFVPEGRDNLLERHAIKAKRISTPLYRVYIGGGNVSKSGYKSGWEQWNNLNELERRLAPAKVAVVGYAVPAFNKLSELSKFHSKGFFTQIDKRWPVMYISPSAIKLPDQNAHCISFDCKTTTGLRYSSEPDEVPGIVPLVSAIDKIVPDKHSPNAPRLSQSIAKLRKSLDELADEMKLDEAPKELSPRALLSIFGISVPRKDGPASAQAGEFELAREFMRDAPPIDVQESQLAGAFRKIIQYSEDGPDGRDESRISFLEDFYCADYRCRQILGHPLMVYANPDSTDEV